MSMRVTYPNGGLRFRHMQNNFIYFAHLLALVVGVPLEAVGAVADGAVQRGPAERRSPANCGGETSELIIGFEAWLPE